MSVPEKSIDVLPPPATRPARIYLLVVLAITIIALLSIVAVIILRPDAYAVAIATSITAIAVAAFPATMGWLKASQAVNDVSAIHVSINSRMDERIAGMEAALVTAVNEAYARGRLEGQTETRTVDKLADGEGAT